MNTPQDPRQTPLQDDEAALARVLRALPAGEPSARVDAAILAAATDAVGPRENASPSRRRLPAWALGTAAAAVLAIGVGLQLRPPLAPEAPAPAEAPVSKQEAAKPAVAMAEMTAEPSADASADAAAGVGPAAAPPPPPPPAPPAPAAAPPAEAPALDQIVVSGTRITPEAIEAQQAADAAPSRRQREAGAAAQRTEVLLETAPSAPAPPPPASVAPLPPVDDDAALAPADWIERIRERMQQGDTAGARASLLRLLQAHPDTDVPADLAPLRS
jgi:type IV secretory pathway VirB10-like protein